MGWWFGRKQAPGDVRPFVPAWLSAADESGFARSRDGMSVHIRSSGTQASFSGGDWAIGTIAADRLVVGGNQVVGARGAAVADPGGGTTVDAEARSAISAILSALRQHGLIAS